MKALIHSLFLSLSAFVANTSKAVHFPVKSQAQLKKIVTMKYLHRFCLSVVYCCYLARVCLWMYSFAVYLMMNMFFFAFSLLTLLHRFRYFQVQWSDFCLNLTTRNICFHNVFECLFFETNTFELIACLLFTYRFLVDVLNQFE